LNDKKPVFVIPLFDAVGYIINYLINTFSNLNIQNVGILFNYLMNLLTIEMK
jgi:hypothetical protein